MTTTAFWWQTSMAMNACAVVINLIMHLCPALFALQIDDQQATLVVKIRGEQKIDLPLSCRCPSHQQRLRFQHQSCQINICICGARFLLCSWMMTVVGNPKKRWKFDDKEKPPCFVWAVVVQQTIFSQDEKNDLHAKFTLTQKMAKQSKKATWQSWLTVAAVRQPSSCVKLTGEADNRPALVMNKQLAIFVCFLHFVQLAQLVFAACRLESKKRCLLLPLRANRLPGNKDHGPFSCIR